MVLLRMDQSFPTIVLFTLMLVPTTAVGFYFLLVANNLPSFFRPFDFSMRHTLSLHVIRIDFELNSK
jgi:hypothetical protein